MRLRRCWRCASYGRSGWETRRLWRLRRDWDRTCPISSSAARRWGSAGEEVYPLAELPRWWVVLIVPPFGIATADAYEWLDQLRARTPEGPQPRFLPGTWLGKTVPLVNDLERPVNERHPVIGTLMDRLTKLGAVMAAMSGSGSTVFGIFTTAAAADAALRSLRKSGTHALAARMATRGRLRQPRG